MRLIDADALLKKLDDSIWYNVADFNEAWYAVDHAPTVDAVEVVRCRDCKYNPLETWFGCPLSHLKYDGERWCWKGERKDGDNG